MSVQFWATEFWSEKLESVATCVVIALILVVNARLAQADVPQCKFTDTPFYFLDPQGASVESEFALAEGVSDAQKGYWDSDIQEQEYALEAPNGTPHLYFMAAMSLAIGYWYEGKFRDGISAMDTALRTHVDDSVAYEVKAEMYLSSGDLREAVSYATKAIAIDPCQKYAYETRATVYRRTHLSRLATDDETTVIKIDTGYIQQKPEDASLYIARGNDENDQGKHDPAIADFTRAMSLNPKDEPAFVDRGVSYGEEGRYVDDVSDQTEAIVLKPKDENAWNDLCWGLAVTGDLDDAMSSCDEALTLAPRDIYAWDSRGFVDLKMKNYAQAVRDYGNVLSIDSEFASSLYGRGLAERGLGNINGSVADIAKAEENDPDIASTFSR